MDMREKEIMKQIKKITSLVLVAAMIIGMNNGTWLTNVYADEYADTNTDEYADGEESEEIKSEEELSEDANTVVEEMVDDESETLVSANTVDKNGEAGEVVFEDIAFIHLLERKFGKSNPAFSGIYKKAKDGETVSIAQSEVDKITWLRIDKSSETNETYSRAPIDLSEISKLSNLGTFIISGNTKNGYIKITDISLPASLKRLTLEYCILNTKLDISHCTGLNYLNFSNNDYQHEDHEILGLSEGCSTLENLEKVILDNTKGLESVYFPDEQKSNRFYISALFCDSLNTIDFGGYWLGGVHGNYVSSLRQCISLEELNVKVRTKCDEEYTSQKLDLRECLNLGKINVTGFFRTDSDVLEIDTRGITRKFPDDKLEIAKSEDEINSKTSGDGNFVLKASPGSYCADNETCSEKYVDEKSPADGGIKKYFVFEGNDKEKWERQGDSDSKKRDYNANPIVLHIGQTAPYHRGLLYSADWAPTSKVNEVGATVQVENMERHFLCGIATSYQVTEGADLISLDTKTGSITAKKPGKAVVKVCFNDGSGSIDGTLIIIIFNDVDSMSFDFDGTSRIIDDNNKHDIGLKISSDSSLALDGSSIHCDCTFDKLLYRKDKNAEWEAVEVTSSGLSIGNASDSQKVDDKTVKAKMPITFLGSKSGSHPASEGQYKISISSRSNFKDLAYKDNSERNFVEYPAVDENYIRAECVLYYVKAEQSCEKMVYGDVSKKLPDKVDFSLTDLSDDYSLKAEIVDADKYDDAVKLVKGEGASYSLIYNEEKSSEEIQEFIKKLQDHTITVKFTYESTTDTDKKVITKTVIAGMLHEVKFDANGGSVSESGKTVLSGDKYGTLPTPTRIGHNFSGWYTEAVAGTKVTSDTVVEKDENHTLYAHWNIGYYPVHFDANGGEVGDPSKEIKFGDPYGELPVPTRNDYEFVGWFDALEGGNLITADTVFGSGEEVTLYAHWTKLEPVELLSENESEKHYRITLVKGNKLTSLKSELKKVKADGKEYKATTTDKSVATISSKGIIVARKDGTCDIEVIKPSTGMHYYLHVTIATPAFAQRSYTMNTADSEDEPATLDLGFTGTKLAAEFSISKKQLKYATVDESGVLTATAKGTVTVVAKVNGKSYKTKVYIYSPAISGKDTVKVNKSIKLSVKNGVKKTTWDVKPGTGNAKITQKGVLKGTAPGTVTVIAVNNNKRLEKTVTITE